MTALRNSHASGVRSRPEQVIGWRMHGKAVILCSQCRSRVVLQRPRPFRRANTIVCAAAVTAEGVCVPPPLPACRLWCTAH